MACLVQAHPELKSGAIIHAADEVLRIDPTDYNVVYSESQGGSMSRRNLRTGQSNSIRPSAPREMNGQVRPGNVVPIPASVRGLARGSGVTRRVTRRV